MDWMIPVSIVIAVTGILTNSLSLSYFLIKEKEGLTSRMFILLNVFDLLLSVVGSVSGVVLILDPGNDCEGGKFLAKTILRHLFITIIHATTWATVLICTTRAVKVCAPFYRIKVRRLLVATVIYSVYRVLLFAFRTITQSYPPLREDSEFQTIVLRANLSEGILVTNSILLVVIGTTIALSTVLLKVGGSIPEQNLERNKRAAVTVIILSVVMFICNIPTQILITIKWINPNANVWGVTCENSDDNDYEQANALSILLLPLNSALNPIIYFSRKEDMRSYFKNRLSAMRATIMEQVNVCLQE